MRKNTVHARLLILLLLCSIIVFLSVIVSLVKASAKPSTMVEEQQQLVEQQSATLTKVETQSAVDPAIVPSTVLLKSPNTLHHHVGHLINPHGFKRHVYKNRKVKKSNHNVLLYNLLEKENDYLLELQPTLQFSTQTLHKNILQNNQNTLSTMNHVTSILGKKLFTKNELSHKRLQTRSKIFGKKYFCNKICKLQKKDKLFLKKLKIIRNLVLQKRKERLQKLKNIYKSEKLILILKNKIVNTLQNEKKMTLQHRLRKLKYLIKKLKIDKNLITKKLTNLKLKYKKLNLKRSKFGNLLKKIILKKILNSKKNLRNALQSLQKEKLKYKDQIKNEGKNKFISPNLVNYKKLNVLFLQKKLNKILNFNFKRNLFNLNYLLNFKNKFTKLIHFYKNKLTKYNLQKEKLNKKLDALQVDNKNKLKINLIKLKLNSITKRKLTCDKILQRADSVLQRVNENLKEKLKLENFVNSKSVKKLPKEVINYFGNKNLENQLFFTIPLKKFKNPYLCTIIEKPVDNTLQKSLQKSQKLFKDMTCLTKTKLNIRVHYTIGSTDLNIVMNRPKWKVFLVKLNLSKKGHVKITQKLKTTLSTITKNVNLSKKMKMFNDRVKYISNHKRTAKNVVKSFLLKYFNLPESNNFGLSLKIVNKPKITKYVKPNHFVTKKK
ncbi:hypothetical protein ABK040_005229 [Willaertia magna]